MRDFIWTIFEGSTLLIGLLFFVWAAMKLTSGIIKTYRNLGE
jgi:hypothetical protein